MADGRALPQRRGVPQDDAQAVQWFQRAAEQGNVAAQARSAPTIGRAAEFPRILSKAYFWSSIALAQRRRDQQVATRRPVFTNDARTSLRLHASRPKRGCTATAQPAQVRDELKLILYAAFSHHPLFPPILYHSGNTLSTDGNPAAVEYSLWPRCTNSDGWRRASAKPTPLSGRSWIAIGCAAMPAATAVRFPTGSPASAKFASITAARSTFPGVTSPECSATRSRRSRFSTLIPGALAYSFGMLGCDLHCSYCQNWVTSQALRDPDADFAAARGRSRNCWSKTRWPRARKLWSALITSR